MQIYYDSQYTQELMQRIEKKFWEDHQDRKVVHLSDLCKCPMKTWCRLMDLPVDRDDNNGVGIMMIGVVGQTIIQDVYPDDEREYEPDKDLPAEERLPSHIDIFADHKFPVEIKWSRKNIMRGSDIGKSWILQVTGYMSKTKSTEGKMVIFNVMTGKLNAFRVVMTEEELSQRQIEMNDLKGLILVSVDTKNPNLLPIWEEECQYCDYRPTRKKDKVNMQTCPRHSKSKVQASQDLSPSVI